SGTRWWWRWLLDVRNEEALINEGRDDQDDGDPDECADAIELAEAAEIVQEKFCQRNNEQRDAGVADPAGVFAHADEEECEGVERPRDRISHVPREISAERKGQ